MEFDFPINEIVTKEIVKIDHMLMVDGYPKNDDLQKNIMLLINGIGYASAKAQGLKTTLTSAKNLINSTHVLYVMSEQLKNKSIAVVGILKMGWKKLYLYDKVGRRSEAMVNCLLDFYIHETKQRKGYGIRLMQHMLKDANLEAKHLAIDKPTDILLQFFLKHFKLSKLVNQGNNFVIFEEFFESYPNECYKNDDRMYENKKQQIYGRHEAHKHHDTMKEILEENAVSLKHNYCHEVDAVNHDLEEMNLYSKCLNSFKTDECVTAMNRDVDSNHSTYGSDNSSPVDLDDYTTSVEVVKVDKSLKIIGLQKNNELEKSLSLIIDGLGNASAIAQNLKSPVTSANKLMMSNHILYIMTQHPSKEYFGVIGILKMGWKKLFLYDKIGARSEAMVFCLLDFYLRETKQRKGYGKILFDFMLKDVHLEAKNLAIDKPTDKLLQFMWKHFKLSKLVNQGNNFVIFEEFFENGFEKHESRNERASEYKRQPTFGRHGAHKHHDTMGDIVQDDRESTCSKNYQYFTDHQSNRANSHSQSSNDNDNEDFMKRDEFLHSALW